ncbi:MAG: hypothetical protein ACRDCK_07670 [Plesiomonas shigelloides]
MQTVSFSVMSQALSLSATTQHIRHASARCLARCTTLGLALLACALPTYAATQSDARQEQVHYECGVFTPQAVEATYQYSESGPQHVVLRYQGEELILPYVERNGRVLTFISEGHKWEVDYPHPAVPGPLDNGRLSQRQPHQVKGWLLAIEQPLERECMAHTHVATSC